MVSHGVPHSCLVMSRFLRVFATLVLVVFLGWPTTASAALDIFGGWQLNRAASKLTIAPKDAETVIIIPWGQSGWVWSQLSGHNYQPEDLHRGVKIIECRAGGACQGTRPNMMLYWASWDSKSFPTYGTRRIEVQVKRVNEQAFEVALFKAPQTASAADKAVVVFSPDGRRMTVTTTSGSASGVDHFEDDVRVYERIDAKNLPALEP